MAMLENIRRISNERYFKFSGLILIFLLLAFDQQLGMIFILILVVDFIWQFFDKDISYPIEKSRTNRGKTFFIAAAASIVFIFSTSFLLQLFTGSVFSTQSIIDLLATNTPVLQGNVFLTIIGWGILIPIIESSLFHGSILEGIMTFFRRQFPGIKFRMDEINFWTILASVFVSALFLLFHVQAKNLENIPLLLTFIFSMFASIITIKTGEKKGAIIMHSIINLTAILGSLGLLSILG